MANILDLKPQERTIEIKHPGDETRNVGIRIRVMAVTDERMQKIRRRIKDMALANNAKGKHFKSDDIEENQNALLFGAMLGWNWYNPTGNPGDAGYDPEEMPELEGNANPEFNRVNVLKMLSLEWFADQITSEISDEKSFFNNSKTN